MKASACSRPPLISAGITIAGEKIVQMMGVSAPTAARMARSAWSCSPSAPVPGSAGASFARSAASASGVRVTVYWMSRFPEGAYLSPHISAKHWARDWGLR